MGYSFRRPKNGITITNTFQNILDESNRKPNKIRVDRPREFYNRSMKTRFQDNDVEMYSILSEGKSVAAEICCQKSVESVENLLLLIY